MTTAAVTMPSTPRRNYREHCAPAPVDAALLQLTASNRSVSTYITVLGGRQAALTDRATFHTGHFDRRAAATSAKPARAPRRRRRAESVTVPLIWRARRGDGADDRGGHRAAVSNRIPADQPAPGRSW